MTLKVRQFQIQVSQEGSQRNGLRILIDRAKNHGIGQLGYFLFTGLLTDQHYINNVISGIVFSITFRRCGNRLLRIHFQFLRNKAKNLLQLLIRQDIFRSLCILPGNQAQYGIIIHCTGRNGTDNQKNQKKNNHQENFFFPPQTYSHDPFDNFLF